MLKKLRWRFIWAVMVSVAAVMLVLLLAVNLVNYSVTTKSLDSAIEMLTERREMPETDEMTGKPEDNGERPPMFDMKEDDRQGLGHDEQNSFRFFSVYCDENGNITDTGMNPFFSIEDTEASSLVPAVLSKGKTSGYYNGYRYLVEEAEGGHVVSFINCEIEIQNMRNLLIVSVIVAVASLLAIFGLVVAISKKAIDPYVKNIEQQKRFITDAGHELKTPITAISASADVLAVEYEGDEWVENIQNQTVRLTKLVGDLITLSRLDEEKPFTEKSEFSLSDAVWEIAEPFSSLAKAKGKEYVQTIEDGLTYTGNKESVQQMVSILLDNAVKYSDENGTVRLNVHKAHKNIVIDVFNTCDLPDTEELDRVFDRFYRLDKSRSKSTGGTGIGLSIAKATAEAHGGSIKVTGEKGKSIRFTVTL